jgi:redox-sensitive bicupin YhaK (pirin superfamily)
MKHNTLLAILQGTERIPYWATPLSGEPIKLNQDATVVVSQFDSNFSHEIALGRARQMYILCIEGTMEISSSASTTATALNTREAAEIVAGKNDEVDLVLTAGKQGAHFLMIEMASQPGEMII